MKQICLVGNSHVAALKMGLDAWQAEHTLADCAIDIFGSRAKKMSRARVHQGEVQANGNDPGAEWDFRAGTRPRLHLDSYDEIYFTVGTRPTEYPHFNPRFILNFIDSERPLRPWSQAVVSRIVEHTVFEQWFSPLLRDMIQQSARPVIHFLGCPFWSTEDRRARALQSRIDALPQAHQALSRLQEQVEIAVQGLETARLKIPAPPAGVLNALGTFTDHAYCTESMRLTEDFERGHGPRDFRHMNAAYGREIIRNILRGAAR